MKWIKCSQEMPEAYVFVLVCEKSERSGHIFPISIARWERYEWNGLGKDGEEDNAFYSDLFWDIEWSNITHWAELPPPPEIN